MNWKIVAASLLACLCAAPGSAASYQPTGAIEQKYAADGPWATTTTATTQGCDREGNLCDIWYPADLGSNPLRGQQGGFRHPVIVFANGTADSVPAQKNGFFLRHLASWGFVVIRSRDGNSGNGDTVRDVAAYIKAQDNDPRSVFHNRIDEEKLGLTGHSQGAATAVKLFSLGNSPFKTFVPIETPERVVCLIVDCAIAPGALTGVTAGSIFFVGGNLDPVSPLPVNLGYYLPVSNRVDKVMGMVALGSHNEIEGDPACPAGGLPGACNIGVQPMLGYPTAWFMWKLQGASDGPAAFARNGELAHAAPNWLGEASNIDD
ncbi:hypothetical protein [uncultured Sphingomonas sp.]|uniref:hypothetical protein n=1 Tax=uncultured Sphingomonas sp. TaxID=158754 RepID=UPI0025DA6FD9|nr:hypothetical protein [uncultured Sphingomonas sp.]